MAFSANVIPAGSAATHWQKYVEVCREAGREPDGDQWHLAASSC